MAPNPLRGRADTGHESGDVLGPLLMRDSLDHCVKCTICETFCPVSNVTPLFPGPKYAGPQAERFRVADEPSTDASVDYCSGCGICTQVCSLSRARACELISAMWTPCGQTWVQIPQPEQ